MRVGIPRALLYYQYFPLWKAFFEYLGAEVVVSQPTTRATLLEGASRVVADTCLPVKVFTGHVVALAGKCDCLFIPVIRSLKPRTYNCAKFLGLPDMTRAVVPEAPPILEIEIDVNRGRRFLYQSVYRLGRRRAWNPLRVRRAARAAWQAHQEYERLTTSGMTRQQALEQVAGGGTAATGSRPDGPGHAEMTIALVGHAYMVYDEHINHGLMARLRKYGVRVVVPEMLDRARLEATVQHIVGRAYWTYEEDVVGAGGYFLGGGPGPAGPVVDGVIGVMAFGCGPDSLMMEIVSREAARHREVPFMCLTLEEHSSEAGIVTRIEAFLDMIARRKRRYQAACV